MGKHTLSLLIRYGLSAYDVEYKLPLIDTHKTNLLKYCPDFLAPLQCTPGKYRRFDGLCNNLANPTWGARLTSFTRLVGSREAIVCQTTVTFHIVNFSDCYRQLTLTAYLILASVTTVFRYLGHDRSRRSCISKKVSAITRPPRWSFHGASLWITISRSPAPNLVSPFKEA